MLRVLRMIAGVVGAWLVLGGATVALAAPTVLETAALMPRSAQVVVVVHSGTQVRQSDVGRTLTELFERVAGFGQTGRAWQQVAEALGLDPGDAFDALLGERMAFASRQDPDGARHWVVVSQIRPGVREKLVRSLKAAPRDVADGTIVLGVEDGAFSMILLDRPEGTFLVIGPGAGDEMLLEVARLVRRPDATSLEGAPELAEFRQLGGVHCNLLALVRDTAGQGSWTGAIGVARGSALDANFRMEMPALAGVEDRGTVWSRQAFDVLSRGALAAAVDISGPLEVNGPAAKLILPLDLPAEMKAVMGSRVAMVARAGRDGPIELAIALETTDSTAMARAGDQWIDGLLGGLPIGQGGQRVRAAQFVSMPPTASRTVDLSRQVPAVRQQGWTAGPMVTWNSRVVAQDCNPGQTQGWWTAGIGAGAVGTLSTIVSNPPPDAIRLPYVAMGLVRPAAILEALARSGWVAPAPCESLAGIDEVRWEAMRSGYTELMGNLKIRVRPRTEASESPVGEETPK